MKRILDTLGSFGLVCVLLGFLFLLTFLGTLEQTKYGLYDVQKKYFESIWLIYWIGDRVPLPLPGVFTILSVLAVSLVVGGLIRIRKTGATAGVIIIHIGILIMLAAAIVKLELAADGHLTLFEKDRSDEFQSYHEWEVAIFDATQAGNVRELLIHESEFLDLDGDRARTFTSDELPFKVALSRFVRNSRPMPGRAPMRKAGLPLVDGWALEPVPLDKEAEQNISGVYVRLTDRQGAAEPREAVLWGAQRFPFTVSWGGRHWAVDLRKKRFKMPFTIVLDDFTHELHPRTGIAKLFMSDVTKIEEGTAQAIKIEMNQPLRHGGLILFQSGWGPSNARPGDPLFSTFAVVRNPSDQWPLVSCIVIAVGMLVAFGQKLVKYMKAQAYARATRGAATAAALALALVGAAASPASADPAGAARPFKWDRETVDLAASIAVQDGGRLKPLDTLAGFKLLKFNGRRSLTTPEGEKLGPVPWFLDCLFFPEAARRYESFLVQNAEVLDAMGVGHESKRKRDRYSYEDLAPGVPALYKLADRYMHKPEPERTPVEGQIVQLAHNVNEFEQLIHFLDFARKSYSTRGSGGLERVFKPEDRGLAKILAKSKVLIALVQMLRGAETVAADVKDQEIAAVSRLLEEVEGTTSRYGALALFAPPGPVEAKREWMSPSDLVLATFQTDEPLDPQIARLAELEDLERSKGDPAAFKGKLGALARGLRGLADARGEYGKIGLEVAFYKLDLFYRALLIYGFAFALVGVSVLRPQSALLHGGVLASVGLATALLIAGIVLRCVIRSRPPVSTLYETILFITAVSILVCGVIELINRQRIASAVAAVLGVIGMFLAMKYEFKESVTSGDTMPSLVAVLDTNFWLATHVTTVTAGYAAGLLASAIAHVWLLGRMLGGVGRDDAFYKTTARMVYGVLLFGLLLSVVGTILGGIWANYSWGRFWGWDPKENGALMICLWELIILHARMGGYIRDQGLCVMAVLGGIVIAFSWWGVNLLGVGLHSYGFTSGVFQILLAFYAIEALLVLASGAWYLAKARAAATLPAGAP